MNKLTKVDSFIQKLMKLDGTTNKDFEGCTDNEIRQLMKYQQVNKLPQIYIDFMKLLGKNLASRIFQGEDILFDSAVELKDEFLDFINDETTDWKFPQSIYVFWVHHGYQWYFFDVEQGQDPPVYVFVEGENIPQKRAESFSDMLDWFYNRYEYVVKNINHDW